VKKEQKAAVKLLTKKGVNLNQLDECDRTPFWWAVVTEDEAVVKWLLADTRIDPYRGQDPDIGGKIWKLDSSQSSARRRPR